MAGGREAGLRAGARPDAGSFTIKELLRWAENLRRVLALGLRREASLGRMPRATRRRRRRPARADARSRRDERRELAATFMGGGGVSGWMSVSVRRPAIAALGLRRERGRALMSGRAPLRQVVSKAFASHRADAEIFTKAANGGHFRVHRKVQGERSPYCAVSCQGCLFHLAGTNCRPDGRNEERGEYRHVRPDAVQKFVAALAGPSREKKRDQLPVQRVR